jgi:serine protease
MPGIRRLLLVLAWGCWVGVMPTPARAGAPEWNPVRTHAVRIGPEASRLVVEFRATASNSVVKAIQPRMQAQSIRIVQAMTSDADVAGLAQRSGLSMARSRQMTPSMHVLFLQKTLYGADVNAVVKKLRADPAVQFADVDQRRYAHSVPDDPLFMPTAGSSGQWFMQPPSALIINLGGTATEDLSATDAVSAWAITTGSSGTVIADIDTGVRFDHPDLLRAGFDSSRAGFGGRLLPGYDFIDQDLNATTGAALGTFLIANDGDGWDPDPSDPGDWISSTDLKNPLFPPTMCGDPSTNNGPTDSSWHGTRVMGVLGALTNNAAGVAGMTWNPYLLPVRALGKCGGYDSDIIAGMQWAAGLTVTGVPNNPYPADIINLSLGGTGACPSIYQTAIDTLTRMGVLVVVSAGNGGSTVDAPANCPGVLAVAGLRNAGTKVGYSSFGPEVGVAAPAGNCVTSSGACYRPIDTTVNLGLTSPGSNSYTDETNPNLGTSFSAPIVSGIAALMRAVNANLTPPQLIARIRSSATPFPQPAVSIPVCSASAATGECACPNDGTQCGAGMVNALSAVKAALDPIATISPTGNTVFDAGGSVAACGQTIASYAWTRSGGVTIQSGASAANVTVGSTGTTGTLMLTVTDSAGHTDSASVAFNASGVVTAVNAPSSAGTAATACPAPMTVTLVPPTVTEAFSPTSVSANVVSTLTITFSNTNGFDLTQAGFTETVPANLIIQTSPAPTTSCTGASGTLTSSASAVSMAGANIPAKGSCSMIMSVKSATAGAYDNAIAANALSTASAGGNSASASAPLTVTAPSKSGGGALDWLDMMFVAGVLLAGRRHAVRPSRAARPQAKSEE